jgi:uncharacterized protein
MAKPNITAELFVIPLDGAYLIYAPLRQTAFVAGASVVNLLADLRDGPDRELQDDDSEWIEFLREFEIIDGRPEQSPSLRFAGDPKPTAVTLFLTTACNLRCTYCYASAGDTPTRAMPIDVAKRGIDFVIANAIETARPGIEIAYHGGGEPTVNWSTLTESWKYARSRTYEHGLTLNASLASNAVLGDERIEWIVTHLNDASISCDGLPEAHDKNRLTVAGQGSFERVAHTLRRFDEAGFPYGIRVTVTRDLIARVPESIAYLLDHFRPRRIQVEPAYALGRWRDEPSAETADFIAAYRDAQAIARSRGTRIEFSAARVGTITNHFCGITQDSFCLTADGEVSACYETFLAENEWSKKFFYGRFDEAERKYLFDLPILENLRAQTVDERPYCRGCFAKWTCGGDCHHKALTIGGEAPFAGTDRCHIIRELTKDQILARIADSGGLVWREQGSSGRQNTALAETQS